MDISDQLGNSITVETVRSSLTKRGVILSPGNKETMKDGKTKLKLLVEMDKRQYDLYCNKTSLQMLAKAYGNDTVTWVAKPILFQLQIINGKDAVIVYPGV